MYINKLEGRDDGFGYMGIEDFKYVCVTFDYTFLYFCDIYTYFKP